MLRDMYDKVLTAADLKAICKSRGFSSEEVASTALFETVFLSEKGLSSAISSLTQDEIALLHILKLINDSVDVTFFKYLYADQESDSDSWRYQSFASQYKDIFKNVRTSLVRKGVLLIAEGHDSWRTTKLERWQFDFPEEFHQFLTSPFESARTCDTRGKDRGTILRRKIKQVITGTQIPKESLGYDLELSNGKLHIGVHEFRTKYLKKWQIESWKQSALPERGYREEVVSPIQLVTYALSQLNRNEWILPDELSSLWRILYTEEEAPDSQTICETGWKWGYLSKQKLQGKSYYRPAETLDASTVTPESYQTVQGDGTVELDLEKVPYETLEVLAQIATMTVVDSRLQISPDLIATGNAPLNVRNHPQTQWLKHNSALFRAVLEKVDENWGKIIIHDNLMVARVSDIGLMVKLQQSFHDHKKVIPLAKEFIAFPCEAFPAIRSFVERSGYVIKTVNDVNTGGQNSRE